MKKYFILGSLFLGLIFIYTQCNRKANATTTNNSTQRVAKLETFQKNGITLTELYSPATFENASLMQAVQSDAKEMDSNYITLNYTAANYDFGTQTDRTGLKNCANSGQGQHVHCIVDNQPYNAIYKNSGQVYTFKDGQHIVLSFLSRSYHESIKNKNAYVLSSVITGKSRYYTRYAAPDLTSPMMFYSRPKGTYKGDETEAVLLDFYLVNCDLSKDGYKVKAVINGTEFILDKWCGYFMEGLPKGKNTVQLTLLDKKGNEVESPFNNVERTFTLE
ncbi:MAG: hypothetical protein R2739_10480 [Chitinophagales bacterium]|nr:phosphopeptide-binding protein [Bacteroidota bacterium]